MFVLQRKQQMIRRACRDWCVQYKKCHGITWDSFRERLFPFQSDCSSGYPVEDEIIERHRCANLAMDQFLYWKQRARLKWDLEGDECTKFFFKCVKARKGKNQIKCLKNSENKWCHDEDQISSLFFHHFKNLYNPTLENTSHIEEDSWNTPSKFIKFLRKPLGVQSKQTMGTYLGCPMEIDGRSTSPLEETVDKIIKCITSWKFSSLSYMGRRILINSVLMALASHIMMVYLFPKRILSKINSTIFRFFWGGSLNNRPLYWVKGSTLKQNKLEGGLNIRDVESLNLALLFKQAWRMEKNKDLLAARIFTQKYGGTPLSLTMTNSAQDILSTYIPKYGGRDERIWLPTINGEYSVKSGYWQIVGINRDVSNSFWKLFYRAPMSQRWRWFCWRLSHNALPTRINLWKRNIHPDKSCIFCGKDETVSHLLIHCDVSKRVWKASSLGIKVEANMQIEAGTWFKNLFCYLFKSQDEENQNWATLIATLWAIWLHRNEIIFNKKDINPEHILQLAKVEEARWNRVFNQCNLWAKKKSAKMITDSLERDDAMIEWKWGCQEGMVNNLIIVDGAWKINSRTRKRSAAIAWVLEENGATVRFGSDKVCTKSPIQTECYAILKGIEAGVGIWSEVVVITDSAQAITMIKDPKKAPVECSSIIMDILAVAKSFHFLKILKCSRAGVSKAHNLAIEARKGNAP
ncbi:hypothetical protein RDABS01_017472 [Bienertia sinuspersici]